MTDRGPLVFRLELPLRLAPTMNAYSRRGRPGLDVKPGIDQLIMVAKSRWAGWKMADLVITMKPQIVRGRLRLREKRHGGRRRLAVVTRYSSKEPDEISCDVIGSKVALDRLKHAEVIVDDNRRWLAREAHWHKAPPGKGRVVVEIYELAAAASA